jgi:hypothetical protein
MKILVIAGLALFLADCTRIVVNPPVPANRGRLSSGARSAPIQPPCQCNEPSIMLLEQSGKFSLGEGLFR